MMQAAGLPTPLPSISSTGVSIGNLMGHIPADGSPIVHPGLFQTVRLRNSALTTVRQETPSTSLAGYWPPRKVVRIVLQVRLRSRVLKRRRSGYILAVSPDIHWYIRTKH